MLRLTRLFLWSRRKIHGDVNVRLTRATAMNDDDGRHEMNGVCADYTSSSCSPPLLPLSTWKRKTGEQNVYAHELLFVRCRDSKSVYKNRSHKIFLDHFWRETILLFFSPPISSSSGWVRSYRNLQLTSTISNGKEQNKVVISTIDQRVIRTNEDVPVYCKRQTQAQQRKR
jgi:hypothetical protein